MKKSLLLLFCVFSTSFLFATHNLGGYITYKHISGLTYEVSITTYTSESAVTADRCELHIDFGDGQSESVLRSNGPTCSGCSHCGESIGNSLKKNVYVTTHDFSIPGTYLMSVSDPNRNQGIVNIPNSIQVPFYIEAEIVISSSGFVNNSPVVLEKPTRNVKLNETYKQSLNVIDLDGDIISYELVTPKKANGADVQGYWFPNSVYIDDLSGELIWEKPQISGRYVFTVKVSQCRNNINIGYTLIDFEVVVESSIYQPQFDEILNCPKDYEDRYSITVTPNQMVNFDIVFKNKTVSVPNTLIQKYFGEPFYNGAVCNFVSSNDSTVTRNFQWQPSSSHLRCAPYIISFHGEAGGSELFSDEVVIMIFVKDATVTNCSNLCNGILSNNDLETNENDYLIQVSPNLFAEQTVIKVEGKILSRSSYCMIYDIYGKEVKRIMNTEQNQFKINGENMSQGIYIYKINDGNQTIGTGKVIKID